MNRFWAKVWKSDGCWEWQGYRTPTGYGKFRYNGHSRRAHRVAWELTHGTIPEGRHVLHDCDNPSCVRPDHLHLGDQASNMGEMFARGRRVATAEKNNAWKLTAEKVREIRACYAKGNVSARALAQIYKVHHSYISYLVRGKGWEYLGETGPSLKVMA